ncbi:SDR family oxidoreductase [Pimelobacter simplex]|uniref:SDR family oxidoreductase n=1 Tax=Nocardioides simplex TaxID=2045 RepID=UPI00366AD502
MKTAVPAASKVLVTGGSQGIGLGIAATFAAAGAQVAIAGRSEARLAAARRALADRGHDVVVVPGDVATRDGCLSLATAAAEALGGLDVLCANAGVYPEQRIDDIEAAHVDHVLDTNLKSTVYLVQGCVPHLRASSAGRVVVISSITGPATGYPGLGVYAASKAGQLGFVRTAAIELAPDGITVNAICPGSIRTEGLDGLGDAAIAEMKRSIPVGRLGEPEDIGAMAVFLAGAGAGFVTGQAVVVDGGQTLPELPGL